MKFDDEFSMIPEPSRERLQYKLAVTYDKELEAFYRWLVECGKNEEENKGYSQNGADNRINRVDQFFRAVWDEYGDGVSLEVDQKHAEFFIRQLKQNEIKTKDGKPYSGSSKRKFKNALDSYYRFLDSLGEIDGWQSDETFRSESHSSPDIFKQNELRQLKKAAINYKTLPKYESVSREEREQLKAYLAQQLGIRKTELTKQHWKKRNRHWKIPSLILVSLSAGLRPIEVERAKVGWFRPDKGALHIPKEDSAKNNEEWEVALTRKATTFLSRWLQQRDAIDKYNDSNKMWLNRKGNPYRSHTLNPLIRDLCEQAGIDTERRDIKWYSVRHTVGTYITEIGGIAQAKEQLRHKSLDSTLRYVHPSVDLRQRTLERIGSQNGTKNAADIMQEVMREERSRD